MATTSSSRTSNKDSAPTAATDPGANNPLGLSAGQYIQELGYDDDVDFALRDAIAQITGEDMAADDVEDVFDAVVMWWRSDDEDLVDGLVDAQTMLSETGTVYLLTPKAGRPGHISPVEINDAAPTAGMHVTTTVSVGPDWSGVRLVAKKSNG
ncbi:DUF3052 domain-containing protein [Brevibacterium sp. 50QC2O2]|jgi:hypothetical protein|uniref:DUF3052 domain-containing protein n=1 Tax=Brevibacterium TaxID=1696 RepID=UPI00211C0117|nr:MULTISPECIES: DUF3052 domain-containing protein [unclassified Brevibacterium]MCQ9366635.1 DUF3052 domain-containing protein [Brevibacterium sp. 91QC2O2]MCQ9384483.1 DUF3052 domain-containing protein [Brevibacterium sp. 68QC2CO]MCQ9389625.1 DUF3052 domain-containing protein [Brevibacterium sp. 50QC2O2]